MIKEARLFQPCFFFCKPTWAVTRGKIQHSCDYGLLLCGNPSSESNADKLHGVPEKRHK